MKVSSPKQTTYRFSGQLGQFLFKYLMVLTLLLFAKDLIWAEGSKDLLTPPTAKRLFLDTRDPQQFKVYANAGEFINVGGSHLGFDGSGFISVYRPNGSLAMTFNDLGATSGLAIINNLTQELGGPTGGGTTNGTGYIPGVVTADASGVWTVVFDYNVNYSSSANFSNITNNFPWTRTTNQAQAHKRAILAYDITISIGGAGNQGGTPVSGRVYTNQFNGLINGNGPNNLTSPTFYVLTRDGYQYQVDFVDADPFRFPISSNSLGLVRKNAQSYSPVYKSLFESDFIRSADPSTWTVGDIFLYEPQAVSDPIVGIVNNKIFFNIPDASMPTTATVVDIYDGTRAEPYEEMPPHEFIPANPSPTSYTTWLYTATPQILNYSVFVAAANPGGIPCSSGAFLFGKGGYFIFTSNIGGTATLQIDIDNNGSFDDPIDIMLQGGLNAPTDSIYWDGFDGLGNPVAVQDSFPLVWQSSVQYGEIHIANADVENNYGGVTFTLLNPPPGDNGPTNVFSYNHTAVGGPISCPTPPCTNTTPLQTTVPYTYTNDLGNDRYLDQWTFRQGVTMQDTLFINIVTNCCVDGLPVLTGTGPSDICEGQDLVLTATNTEVGIGPLTYTWTGPAGFSFVETIGELETSTVTVPNIGLLSSGTFSVTASTADTCSSDLDFAVNVNSIPVATAITGGGSFCAGADVELTAMNIIPGITSVDYTWNGPGVPMGSESGTVAGGDPITLTIPNIQTSAAGTYTLTLVSELGCISIPVSTAVIVNPTPELTPISGAGSYCVDDDVTLAAINTATGINTMICTWNGPNLFNVTQTVNGNDTIKLSLNNVNNAFEGTYTLVCAVVGCTSTPVSFDVVVNSNPEINAISPNGSFCVGDSVTLTAFNVNTDTGPINYTWTGPNPNNPLFPFQGSGPEPGPFPVTIPSLGLDDAGTYTLVLETLGGCKSVPQSVTISINPSPEITITGGGDVCIGQDVTLTATNSTNFNSPVIYIWTGPSGSVLAQGVTSSDSACTLLIPNVSTANNGTYEIFKTFDNNGCQTTATTTLNVLPGLNIVNPTPDDDYCEFSSIVLTATNTVDAGDLTYTWHGPNGKMFGPYTVGSFDPLTAIIDEATLDCSGTWTLDVTSESGCNSNDVTVEINVLPSIRITSVTGGGTYCFNAEVMLNGTGEGSADSVHYTWTDPNGVIIGSGTTTPAGPFPAMSSGNIEGDYILEVIADSSGCSDSEVVTIDFNPLPEVMILNNDTTLCDLDTLEICGQALTPNIGSFSYAWTTPTGIIITGDASGNAPFCDTILPMQDYGEGAYVLVITSTGCTSEPDSFNVSLNPNPTISVLSGGGTFCEGDTIDFCFTNSNPEVVGFFYTCILPDGTQITGQTTTNDTICLPLSVSGTYCCSMESIDGCVSSLACETFTFVPSADLSVTANTPVCANDTLLLSGTNSLPCTGTISYAWNGPNGFTFVGTAPCNGPFTASVPNPVAGVYCLIAPLSSNCPDTACVTVVVNPAPEVVNNTIDGGGTYCEGEEVVLSAQVTISDNTDITYVWCQNGVPIPGETGTVPSGTTVTLDLGQVELSDDGEYCLKLTSVNGCINNPPTCTNVDVNPTPSILTVTGGGTYCEGVDVMLNGTGEPGLGTVSYMWMGPGGLLFSGSAPSEGPFPATIPNIMQIDSGIYTLIVKLGDCADSMSLLVHVNPKPIINVISGNGTFCAGQDVTYSFEIDPNGADSVFWTFTCTSGFDTSGVVTTVTTISITMMVNSTVSCTITAESNDGCEAEPKEITTNIQQIAPPVLDVTLNGVPSGGSSNVTACEGDEMVLTTMAQQGTVTYQWFKDGVLIGETTEPVFPVDPPMAGTYTVTVIVNGCTATSDPVVVTFPDPPIAVDDEYTSNTPTEVTGNVTDNDTPSTNVVVTILEQPSSGSVVVNPDGTFTYTPGEPIATTVTFTYQICLVDCPESCDQATVTITYLLECIVPNVITPNGDNFNDILIIDCLPNDPTNPSRLRIFNRWGDEIISFEPYLNEEGWDGTYGSDKKEVPAATYFYLFERDKNSGEKPISGYIKVSR